MSHSVKEAGSTHLASKQAGLPARAGEQAWSKTNQKQEAGSDNTSSRWSAPAKKGINKTRVVEDFD
jgi:hypothetical protein